MKTPDPLDYTSYADFLADYYAYKVALNPRFNYSVWAKKLGFSNVATLTRVVNGDRAPGAQVLDVLFRYFEFPAPQKEYFATLVRLAKATDPGMSRMCLEALDRIRSHARGSQPLLRMRARNLILWGSADPAALNAFLSEYGFEGILSYAGFTSSVCLNGSFVYESALGEFAQFCLACYVKRKGQAWAQSEMFFARIYSDREEVSERFRSWGSPYDRAEMKWSLEPREPVHSFDLRTPESSVELLMGKSSRPIQGDRQPNDVFGYNPLLGDSQAFRMSFDSHALIREFDDRVDHCKWSQKGNLGKILSAIHFRPSFWTYQAEFDCTIYPPERR